MEFSTQEWWAITTMAAAAIGAIGYFLKRTMSKVDEHDKDINTIKQTYVTKDEFKELRAEIKSDLDKISLDVSDMKEKSLSKQDFYRAQGETNDNVRRVYDLLMKQNGGVHRE